MPEDGVSAGMRRIGRLAKALIFWAVGIGFGVFLGDYVVFHDIRHQLSQEQRAAVYTGAGERPKSKLNVVIRRHDCSSVTKVDVDGQNLLMYAKNTCHEKIDYFSWHWMLKSPDGTGLAEGFENYKCATPIDPGDVTECKIEINDDDRAATLLVWTQIHP